MNVRIEPASPVVAQGGKELHLRVLLIYEDLITGLRARRVFEEAVCRLGLEEDLDLTLWRGDLLREPECFTEAAHEVETADILFLSGHGNRELPVAVRECFLRWLTNRSHQPGALAVSLDSTAMGIPATIETLDALRRTAESAGVDVFLHPCEPLATRQEFTVEKIQRPEVSSLRPDDQFYKHWGINE